MQSLQAARPQTDHKHKVALQRLGKDEYNLLNLGTCLNDFNPVELVENSIVAPNLSSDVLSPEYQEGVPFVKVKGSLKRNVAFWEHIGACFIRDTIVSAYKIPFIYTPPAASFGNNRSAIQHSEFVELAISDLLIAGSVVECVCAPTVVNPLSVSIQASGKKRLILDLRYPNQFLMKSKIKFEDAKTMLYSFIDCSQNWLFSFDIKSGFHHIDILPPDQEFLGFSWPKDGVIRFYKFTVLPFGISTGPYIFYKSSEALNTLLASPAYQNRCLFG